jgi:hypothetical protein
MLHFRTWRKIKNVKVYTPSAAPEATRAQVSNDKTKTKKIVITKARKLESTKTDSFTTEAPAAAELWRGRQSPQRKMLAPLYGRGHATKNSIIHENHTAQ